MRCRCCNHPPLFHPFLLPHSRGANSIPRPFTWHSVYLHVSPPVLFFPIQLQISLSSLSRMPCPQPASFSPSPNFSPSFYINPQSIESPVADPPLVLPLSSLSVPLPSVLFTSPTSVSHHLSFASPPLTWPMPSPALIITVTIL